MNEPPKPSGTICWTDLTVKDADGIREFYEAVIGWAKQPVDMDGYTDYCMKAPNSDQVVAGIESPAHVVWQERRRLSRGPAEKVSIGWLRFPDQHAVESGARLAAVEASGKVGAVDSHRRVVNDARVAGSELDSIDVADAIDGEV